MENKRVKAMLQNFGVSVSLSNEPEEPVFTCLAEQHLQPLAEMIDAETTARVLDELFQEGRIDIKTVPPIIAERIRELRLVSGLVLDTFDNHFPLRQEHDNGSEDTGS